MLKNILIFVTLLYCSALAASNAQPALILTEQQQQQVLQQLKEPMYRPLMERYILDELKSLRQDQQKLREDVTLQLTHKQLDAADR
ncbi:tetratricopeptide domain protein, partial [Pseudoalteromonas rubra]